MYVQFQKNPSQHQLHFFNLLCGVTDPLPSPENSNPLDVGGGGEVLIFSGQFCTVQEIYIEIYLLFLIIYFGHNVNVFSLA